MEDIGGGMVRVTLKEKLPAPDAASLRAAERVAAANPMRGPEIMLAAATAHASEVEKDIAHVIVTQICEGIFPTPYLAAHEVARGKATFCRDFRNTFAKVAASHPQVCGRIDGSRFAYLAWELAKQLVEAYAEGQFGDRTPANKFMARRVIRDFEKNYKPPKQLEPVDEVVVKIEHKDNTAITGDEFRSSGSVREGTLHELAEDLYDEDLKQAAHRQIEELAAETKD